MKSPVRIPPPRRAERTVLPAALAASLLLLGVVQLVLPMPVELPLAPPGRPLRLPPIIVVPAVADPVIAMRPLFAPGRRADAGTGPATTAPMEGARAVGVARVRGATRVFLQAPDGAVVSVPPGGSYRGWQIVRIDAAAVTTARGSERATLVIGAPPAAPRAPVEAPEPEEQQ